MTEGDRLSELAHDVDLDAVTGWLLTASADARAEARQWLHEHGNEVLWGRTDDHDYDSDRVARRSWFVCLLTVALEPPVAAAQSEALMRVNRTFVAAGPELLLRVVRSRDERWVRDFVTAAAQRQANTEVYHLLVALVEERGLPFPEGIGFLRGWVVSMWFTDQAAMSERMMADPLAPQLVHAYLGSPDVKPDPPVLAAAVPLVTAGLVDRDRLVGQAIDVLTTVPRVGAQRTIAALLASLGLTLDDLPGGVPLGQGLVATCHGSVGAVLLPLLLAGLRTPEELAELSTTIAGRPERAQKAVLLKALVSEGLRQRVGRLAVVQALAILRESSDDETLRRQVDTAASRLGVEPAATAPATAQPRGLWSLDPPGQPPVAREVVAPAVLTQQVAKAIAHELNDNTSTVHSGDRVVGADLYLAAIVGHAHAGGVAPVSTWLERNVEAHAESPGVLGEAIVDWVADPSIESFRAARPLAGTIRTGPNGYLVRPYALAGVATAFRYLLAREALLRLGAAPCLLSTPTHDDHTLDLGALVARVRRCQGSSAGPLDLLQALLRLRPVGPESATMLDGLALPVDDSLFCDTTQGGSVDAVDLLRAWVEGGGLPEETWRVVTTEHDQALWAPDTDLSVIDRLTRFAPPGLLDNLATRGSHHLAMVVPRWPDRRYWPAYAHARPGHLTGASGLSDLVLSGEWPIDLPLYDALMDRLATPERRSREDGARILLDLIGQGRLDVGRLTTVALMRLDAGVLLLTRVTAMWDLVAQAGGLRSLWPVMCAVADAACATTPVPAGTADLLRLMTSLLPEVPTPEVPPRVRSYATARGSTTAWSEARHFVETADRVLAS